LADQDCIDFLQWALPQLHLRWAGFRKVRRQVCRRLHKHLTDLGLSDLKEYQQYLELHSGEWNILDALCYISISRFYRDRKLFDDLYQEILPRLVKCKGHNRKSAIEAWSIGCCSGEEPYSLKILWELAVKPKLDQEKELHIIATDINLQLIQRAKRGIYSRGSLKELPAAFLEQAFDLQDELLILRERFRNSVRFVQQDIRREFPEGGFDLILCRNLVFTYFDRELQESILTKLVECLQEGGLLIIGAHEKLPFTSQSLVHSENQTLIFHKIRS